MIKPKLTRKAITASETDDMQHLFVYLQLTRTNVYSLPMAGFGYSAFISYSHADKPWAKWLKRKLENQFLPVSPTVSPKKFARIYEGATPDLEGLPCAHPKYALRDVFRDEHNAGCGPLNKVLKDNISKSKFLIVLCSPASRKSTYVADEIAYFKQTHPASFQKNIIPLIIHGKVDEQQGINECFPEGLELSTLGAIAGDKNRFGWRYKHRAIGWFDRKTGFSVLTARKEQAICKIIGTILGINPDNIYKTRRRRVLRRRWFAGLCLALAIVLGIWYYFRYEHTYTRYFTNYVERNGAPEGIHPLHKEELPLQFQYYEFKIRDRKVREIRCKDSSGELTNPIFNVILNSAWQTYTYRKDGLVSEVYSLDEEGKKRRKITFAGDSRDMMQLLLISGESSYILNMNQETRTRLHSIRTLRNERGEIVRMNFHTNTNPGSRGETADGVSGLTFTRDTNGLILSVNALNIRGNQGYLKNGINSMQCTYDTAGRCIELAMFGVSGEPVTDPDSHIHKMRISGVGTDSITISNIGIDGKPCLDDECYAFSSRTTRGNHQTVRYFDRKQKPTRTKSLYAGYWLVHEPEKGITTKTFFDINGRPTLCKERFASEITTVGRDTTTIAYFDTRMQPCFKIFEDCGVSVIKTIRISDNAQREETFAPGEQRCVGYWGSCIRELYLNELGDIDSCAYFNNPGEPAEVEGLSFVKNIYDDFHNPTEHRCYDTKGHLIGTILQTYDDRGNRTREWIVDALDNPTPSLKREEEVDFITLGGDNLYEVRWQYDTYGHPVVTTYRGKEEESCIEKKYDSYGNIIEVYTDGVGEENETSRIQIKYDSIGRNIVEIIYRDSHSRLKEIDGIARMEKHYDQRDNLTWVRLYDRHNRLTCMNSPEQMELPPNAVPLSGVGCCTQIYDDRDNVIEIQIFDTKMQPLALPECGSVVKYRYDEKDRIVETAFFHLGKPYTPATGYHKQQIQYDEWNSPTFEFLNDRGELINTVDGYAKIQIQRAKISCYDKKGRLLNYRYYKDPINQEKPIEINGFHYCKSTYNDNNTHFEQCYYDIYGRRCTNRELGFSRLSADFDKRGNVICEIYRDSLDRIIDNKNGIAIIRSEYDRQGRQISHAFYHADNTRAEDTSNGPLKDISFYTISYESINDIEVQTWYYYDRKGKLRKYVQQDAKGRTVHISDKRGHYYYDGKRLNNYPIMEYKYDLHDRLHSVEFYDVWSKLLYISTFEYKDDLIFITAISPVSNETEQYYVRKNNDHFEVKNTENEIICIISRTPSGEFSTQFMENSEIKNEIVSSQYIYNVFALTEEMFD